MLEMYIAGLTADHRHSSLVLVLADEKKRRLLPIWIAPTDAVKIMEAADKVPSERPLTFDLMFEIVKELGWDLKCVEVSELYKDTLFASIVLYPHAESVQDGELQEKRLDARPSDAIALALRAGVPILVAPEVIRIASVSTDLEDEQKDEEEFKTFVQGLQASDFNKLQM